MSEPDDVIYPQPPEPTVLQAIGIVTIRHSEHEDVLRMLLRTFLHQHAQEARKHFAYMGTKNNDPRELVLLGRALEAVRARELDRRPQGILGPAALGKLCPLLRARVLRLVLRNRG
jgi:hypothetical protein